MGPTGDILKLVAGTGQVLERLAELAGGGVFGTDSREQRAMDIPSDLKGPEVSDGTEPALEPPSAPPVPEENESSPLTHSSDKGCQMADTCHP